MSQKKEWVVSTSQDRPLGEIKKDLAKVGASIVRGKEFPEIGVVYVEHDESAIDKLRAIPGVEDVSPEAPPAHTW
jgi:hypothetical protein